MATVFRVDLRDKQNNIVYPNIHNKISINDESGYITVPGITSEGRSTFKELVNFNKGATFDSNLVYFTNTETRFRGDSEVILKAELINKAISNFVTIKSGGEHGMNLMIQGGGNTVIGGGESAVNFYNNMLVDNANERLYLVSDTSIDFYVSCQDITTKKYAWSIGTDGYLYGSYNLSTSGQLIANSKSTYQMRCGGGASYAWIDCVETSTNTLKNNILIYPTYTRLNSINNNGVLTMLNNNISFNDSVLEHRGIKGFMAGNDQWYIGGKGNSTDDSYMMIATGDNGNEPIYVRQYAAGGPPSGTIQRTLTLLDGSGNTGIPGSLFLMTNGRYIRINTNASSKTVVGTGCGICSGADVASSTDANIRVFTWYGFGITPSISGQTIAQGNNAFWVNARNGYTYAAGNLYANSVNRVVVTHSGVYSLRMGALSTWNSGYSGYWNGTVMFCW